MFCLKCLVIVRRNFFLYCFVSSFDRIRNPLWYFLAIYNKWLISINISYDLTFTNIIRQLILKCPTVIIMEYNHKYNKLITNIIIESVMFMFHITFVVYKSEYFFCKLLRKLFSSTKLWSFSNIWTFCLSSVTVKYCWKSVCSSLHRDEIFLFNLQKSFRISIKISNDHIWNN